MTVFQVAAQDSGSPPDSSLIGWPGGLSSRFCVRFYPQAVQSFMIYGRFRIIPKPAFLYSENLSIQFVVAQKRQDTIYNMHPSYLLQEAYLQETLFHAWSSRQYGSGPLSSGSWQRWSDSCLCPCTHNHQKDRSEKTAATLVSDSCFAVFRLHIS